MDNQRFILWITLGFLLWLSYQQWQLDFNSPGARPVTETGILEPSQESSDSLADSFPEIEMADSADGVPPGGDVSTIGSTIESVDQPEPTARTENAPVVHVKTDVFDLEIGLQGGDIRGATLVAYPVAKDQPDTKVRLLSTER